MESQALKSVNSQLKFGLGDRTIRGRRSSLLLFLATEARVLGTGRKDEDELEVVFRVQN